MFLQGDGSEVMSARRRTLVAMTADRHELHELVDALPDDEVARLLADARRRVPATSGERSWPPAFFGMGVDKDGRTDLSVSVDEILAGGFGASRS